MPLTDLAINNGLEWVDSVAEVALLAFMPDWGPGAFPEYAAVPQYRVRVYEVQSNTYARCPITFNAPSNGIRQAANICQYVGLDGWTVRWYGLIDAEENFLAILPHCNASEFSNQPKVCYFIDTVTGWIDAPDHVLSVGQNIIFMTGPTLAGTTYPSGVHDPIGAGVLPAQSYSTLSRSIWELGPFKIWVVAEVEDYRFRIVLFDGADVLFAPAYTGWGYYQRIDPISYENLTAGSLTITSLAIAGYG